MCSNMLYWSSIPFLLKTNYDNARCLLKKELTCTPKSPQFTG